jgi:hypothetical protein
MTEYKSRKSTNDKSFKDHADKHAHQQVILALLVTTGIASLGCFALLKSGRADARLIKSLRETINIAVEDYDILNDSYLLLAERYIREVVPHVVDVAA